MSALCHFKKPPSERCRIFICRTSPGGFREVTDWPEAELAWTQTVDSTFTPGVLWIYLMPRKCDSPQRGLFRHLDGNQSPTLMLFWIEREIRKLPEPGTGTKHLPHSGVITHIAWKGRIFFSPGLQLLPRKWHPLITLSLLELHEPHLVLFRIAMFKIAKGHPWWISTHGDPPPIMPHALGAFPHWSIRGNRKDPTLGQRLASVILKLFSNLNNSII